MPHDKVLVITGASTGIGAATAKMAAQDGYRLVLAARSEDKLTALAEEIGALAVPTDVTEWDQVVALREAAVEAYGQVDAVFANAGFGAARGWLKETPEFWRSMVLTNVYGAAITARAFYEDLVASRGHVLLTGSVAGRRHVEGSLYSVTKHAVGAMAESLRQDLNGTGVRTTIVEPGMVDTPFFENGASDWALKPEDIARAVMYALGQPPHVDVNDILVRPTGQDN